MDATQLELDLEATLQAAAEDLANVNVLAIWYEFEPPLSALPLPEQLRLGGNVINKLAELHQARADWLLDNWQNIYDPLEPQIPPDLLQGLVRQSQHLDLAEIVHPRSNHTGPARSPHGATNDSDESVVGEVDQAAWQTLIDAVETAPETALSVAHEERVSDWVQAIRQWFQQDPRPIPLPQLQQQLGWPLVKLWLGLLLGGFMLERCTTADFYSAEILISDAAPPLETR